MNIEIWSDFMCPFCYMGHARLQKAIAKFEHQVEVVYRSFQLMPGITPQFGKTLNEAIAEINGKTVEEITRVNDQVAQTGEKEGLEFNFSQMMLTDSYHALRLSHFAKEQGRQKEYMDAVFKSYFTDALDIGDPMTLLQIIDSIGLNPIEAEEALLNNTYGDVVLKDYQTGQDIGVKGVPFFVINNRYAISGAHSPEVFGEILQKAWEEHQEDGSGQCCSDCTCGKKTA